MNPNLVFSNFQMAVLIMGFLFGDAVILNPAKHARQDAWIASLLGWGMGFLLAGMYIKIASAYPGKNLIQILRESFGKYVGSIFGLLYIGFFLHIPANILRTAGEFMVNTSFTDTPLVYLMGSFIIVEIYALKKGLDVAAKASEILIYLFFFTFIIQTSFLIPVLDVKSLFPVLNQDFSTILLSAYQIAIFPFGEMVVFLMVFPSLENDQKDLGKIVYTSVLVIGSILVLQILRDLLVLGPEIFSGTIFPSELSAKLIPNFTVDPLISSTLSLGSLMKSGIFIYSAGVSLAEFFKVKSDNRIFVIPINLLVMALAVWISKSLFDQIYWIDYAWPYYAFPFEILIPLLIIALTWLKTHKIPLSDN